VVLPWSAQRLINEVDQLFLRASGQSDLQVQSDYAKYLVIRVSGLVEQVVTEIVLAHVTAQASPTVAGHVSWRMGIFQNPNIERILQLVGSFNKHWRDELDADVTDEERGALGSINSQRNTIAHGGSSTISLSQIQRYYDEVKSLLVKVAAKF
jgi:hypothetical protein